MNPDIPRKSASIYEQLISACAETLRDAASTASGKPWKSRFVLRSENARETAGENDLAVTAQFAGNLHGDIEFSLDAAFAAHLLSTPESDSPSDLPGAWLEMLAAAAPRLAATLCSAGARTTLEGCRAAKTPGTVALADIHLTPGDGPGGRITVLASPELRVSLARLATGPTELLPVGEGGHLHRVIDVPLSVTLRFGQRQLTLRELLALSTGSLVELDRQVEEPVDLMLGERIVARGEVVIVDGNYGMRVTQVVEHAPGRR